MKFKQIKAYKKAFDKQKKDLQEQLLTVKYDTPEYWRLYDEFERVNNYTSVLKFILSKR